MAYQSSTEPNRLPRRLTFLFDQGTQGCLKCLTDGSWRLDVAFTDLCDWRQTLECGDDIRFVEVIVQIDGTLYDGDVQGLYGV